MPHDYKSLKLRQLRIIDLAIEGLSNKAIAEELGIVPQTVSNLLGNPLAQGEIARRRASQESDQDRTRASTISEARAKIDASAGKAADTLVGLLDGQSETVQLSSAKEILSLGLNPQGGGKITVIADDVLLNIQVALSESKQIDRDWVESKEITVSAGEVQGGE